LITPLPVFFNKVRKLVFSRRFIAKMLTDMKEALREYERSARRTM